MNFTFFLINTGLLLIPAVLFSSPKLRFKANSKFITLAALINMFVFSIPGEYLTRIKAVVFNPPYLTGMTLWELPAEELLLYISLPVCGLAIYLYLNARFPALKYEKYSLAFSNIIAGICIAMIWFGHRQAYTLVTFTMLLAFILYVEYVNPIRFMYKYYRALLLSLVPVNIIYALLTSIPVIQYNTAETLKFGWGYIPLENQFYFAAMLLLSVYFFELFRNKATADGTAGV